MKLIRTITEQDFHRQTNPHTWSSFKERLGARAVLINENFEIALMYVSNWNYYKLPGGGVDEGESLEQALRRELREEAGADDVEILAEIGEIDEIREEMMKKSIHYCYLVKLIGALNEPSQTDQEIEDGYQIIWVKNLDEAIRLVESGEPPAYGPHFERLRELTFLQYLKDSDLLNTKQSQVIGTQDSLIDYVDRPTVKVIVQNSDNKILIINDGLLPGGGVEGNESNSSAIKRELLEELGIEVTNQQEIGFVIQYRDFIKRKYIVCGYKSTYKDKVADPTPYDDGDEP